jgi:hypothetical protein
MAVQRDPEILPALEEENLSTKEVPAAEPEDEVILERDGIHFINSRVLNPDRETKKTLDRTFLNLVESLIDPPHPGAPH